MLKLPASYTQQYENFTKHGYHTVKRSDRFCIYLGLVVHREMDNVNVLDLTLKRSDQVHTLIKLQKGIIIGQQTLHYLTDIYFQGSLF